MAGATKGRRSTKSSSGSRNNNRNKSQNNSHNVNGGLGDEIKLYIVFGVSVLLFLCNFGIIGPVGDVVSSVMFGLFGYLSYVVAPLVFVMVAYGYANRTKFIARIKLAAGGLLFLSLAALLHMFGFKYSAEFEIKVLYQICSTEKRGGGITGGILGHLLERCLARTGAVLLLTVLVLICIIIVTEKSLLTLSKNIGNSVFSREEIRRRREERALGRDEYSEEYEDEFEAISQRKLPRTAKKVSGVISDTALQIQEEKKDASSVNRDIHEIRVFETEEADSVLQKSDAVREAEAGLRVGQNSVNTADEPRFIINKTITEEASPDTDVRTEYREPAKRKSRAAKNEITEVTDSMAESGIHNSSASKTDASKPFSLPPVSLLKKISGGKVDSEQMLMNNAKRLIETLETFGVSVKPGEISQGPTVTRYEIIPDLGVKVSKIVSLSDDIKLNLAVPDIRIEAPIPGKAAVGIEVPNKGNATVGFRELIESRDFQTFDSKIGFAVGKDISGKVVVADIAKMPHMLIAGATGSGKSVCINTLIMSILYKASPEEVKLIMIDPKVVELSIYNGIPHLLLPVVTDPKKAASTLNWAVAEMSDRYKKFADASVRDLKGYNQYARQHADDRQAEGEEGLPIKPLPQIVIIVDELADLMMVAAHEVEASICRLAQLARAAGIHLILATQRPSVDVITGLIKANMPSRVAFAVSSGTDSRTILDMNGAEKLLGKGDMLFYPQGYPKPARVQGAFVSESEVSEVVRYLKAQATDNVYDDRIIESIDKNTAAGALGSADSNERDELFYQAGMFIIDKDKASIGLLQRAFKIGFNRAARIMDQLCDAGVVGDEEGTKPRKVIMSREQFEQYIEENV